MYNGYIAPSKILSRMKSDQRVRMKVAGDGCRTRVARVKVAGVMVAGVTIAGVAVVGAGLAAEAMS
jgi:hypothetical protein